MKLYVNSKVPVQPRASGRHASRLTHTQPLSRCKAMRRLGSPHTLATRERLRLRRWRLTGVSPSTHARYMPALPAVATSPLRPLRPVAANIRFSATTATQSFVLALTASEFRASDLDKRASPLPFLHSCLCLNPELHTDACGPPSNLRISLCAGCDRGCDQKSGKFWGFPECTDNPKSLPTTLLINPQSGFHGSDNRSAEIRIFSTKPHTLLLLLSLKNFLFL